MSKKHLIAAWLLAVYLLMAVGPAWASLSCHCLRHHAESGQADVCCAHHPHQHGHSTQHEVCAACDVLAHAPTWSAPCCSDRHSTDIALYTNDDDRSERLFAPAHLPVPVNEGLLPAPEAPGRTLCDSRSPEPLCSGSPRVPRAHAPPVCA